MPSRVLLAAVAGAAGGAIVWALVAGLTGYEVGYVAWGVGALVGFAAAKAGGRGTTTGLACAGLALVAIFAGKLLATHFAVRSEVRNQLARIYSYDTYNELMVDAQLYGDVEGEDELRRFLVDRNYSFASEPAEVSAGELDDFRANSLPQIKAFSDGPPPYEAWRQRSIADAYARVMAQVSTVQVVADNLGLFDILFAVLGLTTAFKLGEGLSGRSGDYAARRRSRRLQAGEPLAEERDPTPEPPPLRRAPTAPPARPAPQAPVPRRRRTRR